MKIVHLSDLHLTRNGEKGGWRFAPEKTADWIPIHRYNDWLIEGHLASRARSDGSERIDRLRLLDPARMIHSERKGANTDKKIVNRLITMAMDRNRLSAKTLIANTPTTEDLDAMLQLSQSDTNLRFLKLVDRVKKIDPDIIFISGDLTDTGFGYELVQHFLSPWIRKKRLFCIQGNHDIYDLNPGRGRKKRIEENIARYNAFATSIGMNINDDGAYVHYIDNLAIVGLDSCKIPRSPLSAAGEVSRDQLDWLSSLKKHRRFLEAKFRLCLVHHHLMRMPYDIGKISPLEMGMKLKNAQAVMDACVEIGIDAMFNGHRHHGYMVHLPGYPIIISSPSSTLGCKSSKAHYIWQVNLSEGRLLPEIIPV